MRSPDFILPGYLHRWRLSDAVARYAKHYRALRFLLRWWDRPKSRWNVYLHHILAPDPGDDLHDHAAWSISIPIWRCYRERFADGSARVMFPGRIAYRPAWEPHQIIKVSQGGCWTIWIRGGHRRKWGFLTADGWVPFDE